MATRDQIIKSIGIRGPVLPVQIAKEIGSSILIASAHLSELSSSKEVKISSLKVGGSPLYYLPGQEAKLEGFIDNLPGKEKEAYTLLKQKKLLKDSKVEPSIRVALRQIKDFAVPLQVNYQGNTEIFWRFFLHSIEDSEQTIRSELKPPVKKPEVKEPNEVQKELKKPEEIKPIEVSKPKKELVKEEVRARGGKKPDMFFDEIQNYFGKNNIKVLEEKLLRKGAEYNFTVHLQSSVGELTYFCVAKSKKRVNDGDLSSAFINAQSKKLPVLFLTKGDLTKKAQEMLNSEFKGMKIQKI